ncbi:MAG: DNA cytosine methyltransferase [Steroidobacteraceae bacterium]
MIRKASTGLDTSYPVVDLFAGPGGLGEGFAASINSNGRNSFRSLVSIERDPNSHQTLLLRHFVRSFGGKHLPSDYYRFLAGELTLKELYELHPVEYAHATDSALCISLGPDSHSRVKSTISAKLAKQNRWVLVGGPPCQAYSLVGRSRMSGRPDFEQDERHTLYLEYLRIVADHKPPIFVMENVKGLLSAKVKGKSAIQRIVADLAHPSSAIKDAPRDLKYRLYSLSHDEQAEGAIEPKQFLVRAENYGVPQARHRMFIVGVRSDIRIKPRILKPLKPPTVRQTIDSLPAIRSELSSQADSPESWAKELQTISGVDFRRHLRDLPYAEALAGELSASSLKHIHWPKVSRSSRYPQRPPENPTLRSLYDANLSVLTSHDSRSHMPSDLRRYLFAAVFARHAERSPSLVDFPRELLPKHQNVEEGRRGEMFADRFRVQLPDQVSTTITSHISKDGHYFIHYDPVQCRSLTVREAARLQTFPDNYYFCGPRTSQYHQVGNAVPPYLAGQIAEIVAEVLDEIGTRS